ncbi:MAG: endonuclease [Eubacteriales bacterium]|nr:endonuclease [Eubacteriales bacterium]
MITASEIYEKLLASYGQPRWWSDNPYIVMVQSVLVQNTAWASVEKVTDAFPKPLTPEYVVSLSTEELESLIRPCGFAKAKAATIRRLTEWYGGHNYHADKVMAVDQNLLRNELLQIKGIGAETADVILVYAFHKPSFIVDAYTRRFLDRMSFGFSSDDEIRIFFESGLYTNYQLYGWYHWLILEHGISCCRKTPLCDRCIFAPICNVSKHR